MKPAYGEIIRGEVSIFRGGAGGLSYLSGGICPGANWADLSAVASAEAEAVPMAVTKNRQINKLMLETVEDLICGVYRFG
jgi:hypothetical protein